LAKPQSNAHRKRMRGLVILLILPIAACTVDQYAPGYGYGSYPTTYPSGAYPTGAYAPGAYPPGAYPSSPPAYAAAPPGYTSTPPAGYSAGSPQGYATAPGTYPPGTPPNPPSEALPGADSASGYVSGGAAPQAVDPTSPPAYATAPPGYPTVPQSYPSAPPAPAPYADAYPAQSAAPSAGALRDAMLAAHNAVRARVGVPPLTWSVQLAATAQDWADHLVATGAFAHRPNNPYGENIYGISGGTASAAQVVSAWAAEASNYDLRSNSCATGMCGHYTQIVWQATQQVGCAVARGAQREIWVCNYDPPGNVVGYRPF
jgi:pathogenesis-related protein 1